MVMSAQNSVIAPEIGDVCDYLVEIGFGAPGYFHFKTNRPSP
jgi:hypothetical protein